MLAKSCALILVLLIASPAYGADLPTPELTPGAINPAVTQWIILGRSGNDGRQRIPQASEIPSPIALFILAL